MIRYSTDGSRQGRAFNALAGEARAALAPVVRYAVLGYLTANMPVYEDGMHCYGEGTAEAERLAPKDMVAGAHAQRLAAVVVGDLAYGARKRRKRRLSDDDDDFALDGP